MSEKTVVVELRIKMLRTYPADWDMGMIEFFLNDSSHCLSNEIAEIYESDRIAGEDQCCDSCGRTEGVFLRDATQTDLENLRFRKAAADQVIEVVPEQRLIEPVVRKELNRGKVSA